MTILVEYNEYGRFLSGHERMQMSFLLDPNVTYLLLVLGFVLGILALFTPGTGLLEIGALFAIALAGYGIYQLAINWWALLMMVAGIVPLIFAVRKPKRWYWLLAALALMVAGSIFLFPRNAGTESINPFFASLVSIVAIAITWWIGRKGLEAVKMRPSQDLRNLIGQIGEARTRVHQEGTVYAGGEEWSARSLEAIPASAQVKVVGREGLVLIVEPVKESSK
jgi:membrane-bound serine protease (ClpP class)